MQQSIHPTAIIAADVTLGDQVIIHPYVVIAAGVKIGNNVEIFPGAFIGKEPKGAGALARPVSFKRQLVIQDNCSIGPHAVIYYDVNIGNNTLIGDGASIREQVSIGNYCVVGRNVTIGYNVTIGNRTKMMDLAHICGNTVIGDDVFMAMNVVTANDNKIAETRVYDEERMRGPIIENGASIGAAAILLPGVTIGAKALVAAGAVVSKDVAAATVVAGLPAKYIKDL